MENILLIIFYFGLASFFLGIFTFPFRDIVIGLIALIIALAKLFDLIRGR